MSMPRAALTTGGPPGNTCEVFSTITFQCASEVWSAPSPAAAPSTTDATGTTSSSATSVCAKLLASGRYVRPSVSTLRTLPPDASMRRTCGRRHSSERSLAPISSPRPPECSYAPPCTVKSPAMSTTLRPPMRHVPSTWPRGVKLARSPCSSYTPLPRSAPNWRNVPGSANRSIRSRTVSLPRLR